MTPSLRSNRLLAIYAIFISHTVSNVAGFQSIGQQLKPLAPLIRPQSASNSRYGRHVLYESKEQSPAISSSNNNDKSNEESKEKSEDILASSKVKEDAKKGALDKDSDDNNNNANSNDGQLRGKKLGLMWCAEEFCKDAVRERVSGEHNQIILDGPATGQVAYYWKPEEGQNANANKKRNGTEKKDSTSQQSKRKVTEPSILLLVKPNDNDLYKVAAEAVNELTTDAIGVRVYMDSSLAGKLKFNYNVDNERIQLFEPEGTEGFGGNHVDVDDQFKMNDFSGLPEDYDAPFDLICTLGGDGLLMHASMLFQGPVPPVISIAGGSLGFLTQFSREEMVDAIRIALGISDGKLEGNGAADEPNQNDFGMNNVFPPNMPAYPYEPLKEQQQQKRETPRFSFGLGDRICLSIRMRLDCRIFNREGVLRARFNVLNEVVIDRGSSPYLANLECFCDDVHLTTVQADGVIFATPTGSTAYSMAAGGSVVHPAVPCILVTPICPHVLSFRSMVFPDHVVLRCYVPDDARSDASVAFDGRYRRILQRGDSLQIQMSAYPVPTLNRADHSSDWLGSLKRSFNFNTRPRQKPL